MEKALTWFFLILGFATLAAYIKIGYENQQAGKIGERYVPTAQIMEYKINNGRVA